MRDYIRVDEQRPCVNGCVVAGTEKNPEPTLMLAHHGAFCNRCYYSIKNALDRAPEIVEHITSLVQQNMAGGDDKVDGTREAPLPFNVQAFTDANEIYSRLVYWTIHWSARIGVARPMPAVRAWRNKDGIVGLPYDVNPGEAKKAVETMSRWLAWHIDEFSLERPIDDANYFRDELKEVYQADARWPRIPKPYYSRLPCPDDGGPIAVYPPAFVGAKTEFKCEVCGRLFDETRHEFYANLFAEIQAAQGNENAIKVLKQRERTVNHLTRKYAA